MKINWAYLQGSNSGLRMQWQCNPVPLSYMAIYLIVYFILLISGRVHPSIMFKIVLTILTLLSFPIHFRISLSIYKKSCLAFYQDCAKFIHQKQRINVFILCLLIDGQHMSLRILRSFLISFISA